MGAVGRDRGWGAGLDGLRGVAILLVLGQHAPTRPLTDGFVGVAVFFCLSGYLITTLLVRELQTGTIDVRAFYRRRVARLGPGLLAVVAVTIVALVVGRPDLGVGQVLAPAGAALTYTTSLFDWSGHSFATKDYFNYTWSLSVEEQFYLLWPFVLLAGYRRSPRLFAALTVALVGVSLTADLYLGLSRAVKFDQHEYVGTDTNALPILAGALLAIVVHHDWLPRVVRHLAPYALAALLLLPVLAYRDDTHRTSLVTVAGTVLTLVVLTGVATRPQSSLGALLSSRPLRWLGERSYSIYLWNVLVRIAVLAWLGHSVRGDLVWVAGFVVLAESSLRFVERPLRARLCRRPGGPGGTGSGDSSAAEARWWQHRAMRVSRRASVAVAGLVALSGVALAVPGVATADPVDFTVRANVNQVYVLGAAAGEHLQLLDHTHAVVQSGTADADGSLVWRDVDAGSYTARNADTPAQETTPFTVADFDDAQPPASDPLYTGQTLTAGFHYITTRDGTTLSANVVLPSGSGPFPTVVEYSGYDPSNPANTTFSQLFTTLGYAYVGVNVRGTGCSGGSFRPFEPVQSIDGYDVIETIAAQSWAQFHKVGMVGISYPGIEQLYVAQTRPPSLAAITPLSVIDDTYRSTLYPGGILNTGFAVPWATDRTTQAMPYGQGWEQGRVDGGDTTCAANQQVRLQNPDVLAMIQANRYYTKGIGDPMNPSLFVHKINVPVFIAGAWQDEQTGGHSAELLNDFTSSPHVYATFTNGSHTESLSLGIFGRYADFLDLYVGRRVPGFAKQIVAPILAQSLTGVGGLSLPTQPDYSGLSYSQALAKYQAQKPIRVLFEEGAAAGQPSGAPLPRFERSFSSWPVPSAKATAWVLTPGGHLSDKKVRTAPRKAKARSYLAKPHALPATIYSGSSSGIWAAHPHYAWRQIPAGTGLGWISAPLKKTTVAIGSGSVDLWVRTPAHDTDLEVTLSEVRPNGTEVYVQSGWLRASHRKLDAARSTSTYPVHTDLQADARPLPAGQFTKVRIALFPFAHPFRKGSRLRITVDAPGNSRPLWAFDTIDHGERVYVAADKLHPSRLVLAVVPGVAVPTQAPPCRSLRSQPCRKYPR